MKYQLNVFKGKTGKGYCYEITSPMGAVIIEGARAGSKKEVESYLQKPLDRLNQYSSLALSRGRVSNKAPSLSAVRVN